MLTIGCDNEHEIRVKGIFFLPWTPYIDLKKEAVHWIRYPLSIWTESVWTTIICKWFMSAGISLPEDFSETINIRKDKSWNSERALRNIKDRKLCPIWRKMGFTKSDLSASITNRNSFLLTIYFAYWTLHFTRKTQKITSMLKLIHVKADFNIKPLITKH